MSFSGFNQATNSPSNEFEVGGHKYTSVKMDVFDQLHVLRKLGPMLARIGPAFIANTSTLANPMDILNGAEIGPAIEALSTMPEADCNYVIEKCLAVTKRFQPPSSWVTIFNVQARRLQFEDINLQSMLQITMRVLADNLANFSQGDAQNTVAPQSQQSDGLNMSPLPTVRIT